MPSPRRAEMRIAIIGSGFSGIGMAIRLKRMGFTSFTIYEAAGELGGTWRDNTYPGVACDIPSHLYGFAAHPNPDWSGVYATGPEIRAYLERVAADEGIVPRLESPLTDAAWDDEWGVWRLRVGGPHPVDIIADALVLACGRLTEPRIPDIPGLAEFDGPVFHSSRWRHDVDLDGARIAVVGTGASAVQLVPELARTSHVTLFQRSAAWIVPRGARPYTNAERRRFRERPELLTALREDLFVEGEARFASRSGDAAASALARDVALNHLRDQVADPALRASLTPGYAFGCKRVLLSDDFYPAVASDGVTLEASALASVEGRTLLAASGRRHEVDAIVFATGFASTQQPYADLVTGEQGTLAQHWSDGMTSYASTMVSGFPNLFVLDGPNASLGHNSSVLMIEEQAAYLARTLAFRYEATLDGVLRVDPAAERAYTAEIDRAAASTPWITGGCRNWYVDERSGRLTLLWPGTVTAFRERLAQADGSEFVSPLQREVA